MLKSKRFPARVLSGLLLSGVFVFTVQAASDNDTVFNYLTIAELLAIDNEIALEQERENAERFGLTSYKSQKTLQREREQLRLRREAALKSGESLVEIEQQEAALALEQSGKQPTELNGDSTDEQLVEMRGSETDSESPFRYPSVEVFDVSNPIESSRLIGVYGVGGELSALVEYDGEMYQFKQGRRQPVRRTKSNALQLVRIDNNCVQVIEARSQDKAEFCL